MSSSTLPRRIALDFFHYRQIAVGPGADHQTTALPGYVLFSRERCMAESLAKFLGGFLLSLADFPTIDHHIVLVRDAIDPNQTEGKNLRSA